jgi:pimeloyl-ACP methyl ester carboxylesterase
MAARWTGSGAESTVYCTDNVCAPCISQRHVHEGEFRMNVSILAVALAGASLTAHQQELEIAPCQIEGVEAAAECGRLFVYENRATERGRKIPIYFVRFRATSETRLPDPMFVLTGGPGENATARAAAHAAGSPFLNERDVVVFDQRGTGQSNALDCVSYDLVSNPEQFSTIFEKNLFEPTRFRECAERLKENADLGQYTTTNIAADIDDLRAALGYEKINLTGGSYGTTLALEFIRRHGENVRAAILGGVIPPSVLQNQSIAKDFEDALSALFDACEVSVECANTFPTFRQDFFDMLAAVKQHPVEVTLPHSVTNEATTVTLAYAELVTAIRYQLYSAAISAALPFYVASATEGDFAPIAGLLPQLLYMLPNIASEGLWASVRCAEEAPFIDMPRAVQASQNTVLGTIRLEQQEAICSSWPRGRIPSDFHDPVVSDVPVLLMAGEVDAATPVWMAEEAAKTLANGKLVVFANSSHWDSGEPGCYAGMVSRFLADASVENIDSSCAAEIQRPPFGTSTPEFPL